MPKTKEEVMNYFSGLYDVVDEFNANPGDVRKMLDAEMAKVSIYNGISNIFAKIVGSMKTPEDAYEELKDIVPEVTVADYERRTEAAFLGVELPGESLEEREKRNAAITEVLRPQAGAKLTHADKMAKLNAMFADNPQFMDAFHKTAVIAVSNTLANVYLKASREKVDELFGKLVEKYPDSPLIQPDEESLISPYEHAAKVEIHTREAAIAGLKAAHSDDSDFCSLLDEANEICTFGTDKSTGVINPIFEAAGKAANDKDKQAALKYLNGLGFENGQKLDVGRDSIDIKNSETPEYKPEIVNKIAEDGFKISPETKDALMNAYQIMKEDGIDGNFSGLTSRVEELEKAIDSGDKERIEKATEAYRELDEKYEKLIDILKDSVEDFDFPMNLSAGRQSTVPLKYRNDVQGASLLRTVANAVAFCKKYDMDFESLVNNPVQATIDLCCNAQEKDPGDRYCQEHSLKDTLCLVTATQGEYSMKRHELSAQCSDINTSIGNGISGLCCFASDRGKAYADAFMLFSGLDADAVNNMDNFNLMLDQEKMNDLIMVEPKDRKLKTFGDYQGIDPVSLQKFERLNTETYFKSGKTSPEGLLSRLIEAKETIADLDKKSAKLVRKSIEENLRIFKANVKESDLSAVGKRALQYFEEGKLNKITSTDRNALVNVGVVKAGKNNPSNFIAVDVNKSMNNLYQMSQDYDSRWFFQKWWGPETNRLAESIELMKTTMKEELGEARFNEKWNLAKDGKLKNGADIVESTGESPLPEQVREKEAVPAGEDRTLLSDEDLKDIEKEILGDSEMENGFISDKDTLLPEDEPHQSM